MKLRPRRLLVRVYLFGLLLLLCVGTAQFAVGRMFLPPTGHGTMRLHMTWIIDKALPVDAAPLVLHKELSALYHDLGIQISLYDEAGNLLDSTANPPLAPLAKEDVERLRSSHALPSRKRMLVVVGRYLSGRLIGYALALPRRPEPPAGRVLMPMLLALILVAGASVPFARSLTKPLERLAATAQRLGQGDLHVREAIHRQDEVGDLAHAINEMAERIEQLMRAEKELLANVSHELRTPLARIRVALELASSDGGSVDYLLEIADDLAELERLVDDILTTTRLELAQDQIGSHTTPLRLSPTDPQQVVARAVARFTEHHPEHALIVEANDPLPTLQADPAMLRRVLDNLLENAHKYSSPDQSIKLRAHVVPTAEPRSSAAASAQANTESAVEIEIIDSGIGIDAVDLPHVFTPFFRSDRSRARKTGGVGLGLPLARRIARAHGGDIALRSEVGIGTTATVHLPVRAI